MTILGTVGLRDWDEGCMKTLGAEIVYYEEYGDTRGIYACSVPGLDSGFSDINGMVPCQFQDPEDVYQRFRLPCFQFKRNDLTPAFDRKPWYGWSARAPSKDAIQITLPDGTIGYNKYDNQWRANPFDIQYDCMLMARRTQDMYLMLQYALRHFIPPWFIFKIVDSKGSVREYDAGDLSFSNITDLIDIAERMVGYSISFTVRGEIDIHDDMEETAMISHVETYARYTPEYIRNVNENLSNQ